MPINHNILLVIIDGKSYICDPGLASASPRFPLNFEPRATMEMAPNDGDEFKMEVANDHYNLYWKMKGNWFLLYRFGRDTGTGIYGKLFCGHPVIFVGLPITCERDQTLGMCKALYSVPDFIPVRDKYVKISRQFDQGTFSFHVQDGTYNFKHFRRGQLIENRDVDFKDFYKLVEMHCHIKFTVEPLKVK